MTGFGFHAAPPSGHWINDPNGLIFAGGRYRLFVQHRSDAPDYVVTGWGRFSSDDLLHWDWEGNVLAAGDDGFAYSGSIIAIGGNADDGIEAWHTRHRPESIPRERQFVARSLDGGQTWAAPAGPFGPHGRNARDPFVFRHGAERRMLVACPGDWADTAGVSRIELASEAPEGGWTPGADVGLTMAPGLLCEVPSLWDFGDQWALVASFVDRGGGAAASYCGYWLGHFDGAHFYPEEPVPRRVDLGPDFYAAIPNLECGWPAGRMMIGWASSWATARQFVVPGGGSGGAISLPRKVELRGGTLHFAAIPGIQHRGQRLEWNAGAILTITSDIADLRVELAPGQLTATRRGATGWNWACHDRDVRIDGEMLLFCDAGLVEMFLGGIVLTVMVPGRGHCIDWNLVDG